MSLIKIEDVAFVRFNAPDLGKMRTFLLDFGLVEAQAPEDGVLRMRGAGSAPYLHETVQGDPGFAGVGLRAANIADLKVLADVEGAAVEALKAPGGGQQVTISDPDGIRITVVAGQTDAPEIIPKDRTDWNNSKARPRARQTRNPPAGKATVMRLGHCVFSTTDLQRSSAWWKDRFGFITSDEVYDGEKKNVAAFMRCDRGATLTDHHTITLSQMGREPGFHHAAFEVVDFDDLMAGHEYLQSRGYVPAWGVGRHVVGSQIFDYWLDPFGNRMEHWTDGDLFTAEDGTRKVTTDVMLSNHWGPPPSPAFMNSRSAQS